MVLYEIDKISSLSTVDFINLVGHYNYLASDKTESAVENRGYSPEALAEVQKKLNSNFTGLKSLGLHFTKPLNHFKYDVLNYALTLFENYERGSLPFTGSVSEQPAQVLEIFGILQALRFEREEKKRKQSEGNVRKQANLLHRNNR